MYRIPLQILGPVREYHHDRTSAETEEYSDNFQTIVLPAASAGTSLRVANSSGEFHGVIAATTPKGSSRVKLKMPGLSIGMTRPSSLSARPPK